jgi:RNA polymerase sigma-70 factor (ECF subfamily)
VALTLRTICGLSTEAIARAFLVPAPTLAQRLVHAKAKIKGACIPYEVPGDDELADRLDSVLTVVYLVFNEGYAASFGAELVHADLCVEAIRLGRLLVEPLLAEHEPKGLLARTLLHNARRATHTDDEGAIVLLEDQDRSR